MAKCIINFKRNLLGIIKKVEIEDCSKKQIESVFKKRNINFKEINLIKKN